MYVPITSQFLDPDVSSKLITSEPCRCTLSMEFPHQHNSALLFRLCICCFYFIALIVSCMYVVVDFVSVSIAKSMRISAIAHTGDIRRLPRPLLILKVHTLILPFFLTGWCGILLSTLAFGWWFCCRCVLCCVVMVMVCSGGCFDVGGGVVVPFWLPVDPNKICMMSLNLRFRVVAEMSVSSFLLVMLFLTYSSHKNMTRTPLNSVPSL
jgi:hypothetical protein